MRVRTPVGRLPATAVVVANAVFWPCWTVGVGYLSARTPDRAFDHDTVVTRLRPVECDGRWYREQWRIDRWKDRLPERGAVFGGFAKRSVGAGAPELVEQFVVETRRAETAHWAMAAGAAVTGLWNPWWALPVNVAVGAALNLPCVAVQRYNRARLTRLIARRSGVAATRWK